MLKNNYAVIIYKLPSLFNILNELNDYLDFKVFSEKDFNKLKFDKFLSVILVTKHNTNHNFQEVVINEFPIKVLKLIEKINLSILKHQFLIKSNFFIGNFKFDTNAKTISYEGKMINLTEKEMYIITYMIQSKKSVSVDELENVVWNYKTDLETHTVETHIYRLRKKINENFDIKDFILNEKNGYSLNLNIFK